MVEHVVNRLIREEKERLDAMRQEAARLEEDATLSSKGHADAEQRWMRRHYWMGVPATALCVVAGVSLIKGRPNLASPFVLVAATLTGLLTLLKPNDRAAFHRSAAGHFLALRNDARFFREVETLHPERPLDLPDRMQNLTARRNELSQTSPGISCNALLDARKGEYRPDQRPAAPDALECVDRAS
jgi:hypothetical protein